MGVWLHYHKIVENEHFGYPVEWFPSVSATIGDRYPERSVFQLFIAICSGPRFVLVFLWYCLTNRPNSSLPKIIAGVGVFRTFTCGGWTYVTSTDDHNWHDIFMISYLVATLPWTLGCLALSPPNPKTIKYRKYLAGAFFGTLVPLVYFFIQHKVHRVPGGMYDMRSIWMHWTDTLVSLHHLCLLRVVSCSPRRRLRCRYCHGLQQLRACRQGCKGSEQRVRPVASEVAGTTRRITRLRPNTLTYFSFISDKERVADAVLEKEKDKPIGQVFDSRFSWELMLDAMSDVYLGVR